MPGIRFGTWVGGDRDGHPFVTAEVTGEALKELHQNAIELMHESLQRLAIRLPLSALAQSQGKKLSTRLAEMRKDPVSQSIPPELQEEPWKEFVWHMIQGCHRLK
ncbi:MAG: phosphoenolpyruvate carboxylase [Verrucomicrobia bacterium]|nr:phosphoenolpyruvate carboxylase [Verrucomicrobiota bacterium]